jgi:L-histidine Nalpha-methyltransferase
MADDVSVHSADKDVVRTALASLSSQPKSLPPRLLYDTVGCELFYRITELPEYYLTRTEMALLPHVAPEVATMVTAPGTLIEYGASLEAKANILLAQVDHAARPVFSTYIPVDIATAALAEMARRLRRRFPHLHVDPVAADFTDPIALPAHVVGGRVGFFPGSTIGNLEPPEAREFLVGARAVLGRGALMIVGVDLRKDPIILVRAYDDVAGVTAAFNLNLLARLNREAGANFDLRSFRHVAVWNDAESRIEMHLRSCWEQVVRLANQEIRFVKGETIHTENSYKYTLFGFAELARSAGWRPVRTWRDPAELFSIHLLVA